MMMKNTAATDGSHTYGIAATVLRNGKAMLNTIRPFKPTAWRSKPRAYENGE